MQSKDRYESAQYRSAKRKTIAEVSRQQSIKALFFFLQKKEETACLITSIPPDYIVSNPTTPGTSKSQKSPS
jgi:hypothetical protein